VKLGVKTCSTPSGVATVGRVDFSQTNEKLLTLKVAVPEVAAWVPVGPTVTARAEEAPKAIAATAANAASRIRVFKTVSLSVDWDWSRKPTPPGTAAAYLQRRGNAWKFVTE
jgi:hypothetical protein